MHGQSTHAGTLGQIACIPRCIWTRVYSDISDDNEVVSETKISFPIKVHPWANQRSFVGYPVALPSTKSRMSTIRPIDGVLTTG